MDRAAKEVVARIQRIVEKNPDAGISKVVVLDIMTKGGVSDRRLGQVLTSVRVYRRDAPDGTIMYYPRGHGPGRQTKKQQDTKEGDNTGGTQTLTFNNVDFRLNIPGVIQLNTYGDITVVIRDV